MLSNHKSEEILQKFKNIKNLKKLNCLTNYLFSKILFN